MSIIAFFMCVALGAYGAVKAARIFLHGERGALVFTPLGAFFYISSAIFAYTLFLVASKAEGSGSPADAAPILLIGPFLVFPYALYLAGFAVTLGAKFFSVEGSIAPARSYDKGDAAMQRKAYAQAAALYRLDLERWPGDLDATLRLARALEAGGDVQSAARELETAHRARLNAGPDLDGGITRPDVKLLEERKRQRNEGIVILACALGDLYTQQLAQPGLARNVYEETLERCYGYSGVEPLRQRLKRLEAAASEPQAEPEPERIALD